MSEATPSPKRATLRFCLIALACAGGGYFLGASKLRDEMFRSSDGARPQSMPMPSFADAVARCSASVVAVRAIVSVPKAETKVDGVAAGADDGPQLGVRDGSGFVVHERGLIVTARHLTVGAERVVVDVPEQGPFQAQLVGEDEVTDLAALRLLEPPAGLQPLTLGPSEALRAGDWVVAVGNPYGFRQSVTAGVISYVGRHLQADDMRVTSEFLQFSAAVNPGSSGCPILDPLGRVVGVTTQGSDAAQGLSFAIPSTTVKWALEAMDKSKDGRVHRGRLGISFEARRGNAGGCVVRSVIPGQAADEAGIEPGDIVLAIDGQSVTDSAELHSRITRSVPGASLRISLERRGERMPDLDVTLRDAVREPKEPSVAR